MSTKQQLALGRVFGEVFRTYRENAAALLSIAAVVFLPLTLLTEIVTTASIEAGMAVSLVFSGSAAFLYAAVIAPVAPGFRAAGTDEDEPARLVTPTAAGSPPSMSGLWAGVRPFAGRLLLAGLVYTVATSAGVMLLIVPGLILVTIWAVAPAALRIESTGAIESLRRSQRLVRGHGWQVFALVLCAVAMIFAGSILLQALAIAIAGEETGSFVGSWLGVVIAAPLLGLLPTVLYGKLHAGQPPKGGNPGDPTPETF